MSSIKDPCLSKNVLRHSMKLNWRTTVGLTLIVIGIFMSVWSQHGYGRKSCGMWGLDCALEALAWHFGIQSMAATFLWSAALKALPNSIQKKIQIALAVCATLLMIGPAIFVAYEINS